MSEFTHVMWITWIKSVHLNYPGRTWSSTQNQTLSLMWGLSVKNGMFWSEIGSAFEDWGNKSKKISHYFTIRERKKTNLSELTQEFCGLLSKYFYAEIKCIGAKLTVVSLAAIVCLVTQCHIFPIWESTLHDETKEWLRKRLCLLLFL